MDFIVWVMFVGVFVGMIFLFLTFCAIKESYLEILFVNAERSITFFILTMSIEQLSKPHHLLSNFAKLGYVVARLIQSFQPSHHVSS